MKSPNTLSTSCVRMSFMGVRKGRTFCSAIVLMLICPLAFVSCQSANSGKTGMSKRDNPYAKYDPKTPEEEAYYRDVYSGNWSEDTESGLASVFKHSGSTTLPKHWQTMPPGARTLEDIRFEASQRKMAEVRSSGRAFPTRGITRPATNAPVPSYAAPVQSQAAYSAPPQTVPAPVQVPSVNSYPPTSAPLAQPYVAMQPTVAQPNPYAQVPGQSYAQIPAQPTSAPMANTAPQYPVQTPGYQVVPNGQVVVPSYAVQTPPVANPAQNVEFVAQAPTQPVAQPVVQPQTIAPQPSAQPSQTVYPRQQTTYPGANISASVDLFDASKWLIRGQEPEDDPFADEDDPFADDSDDVADEDDDVASDADASVDEDDPEEEKSAVSNDVKEEKSPAVDVTTDNVTVKSVAPEAKANDVVLEPVGASTPVSETIAAIRSRGRKLALKVDPKIAEPYANVRRPNDAKSAQNDQDRARREFDEYIVSGGDANGQVVAREDWSIENLESEDSVAHFDTIDGRILIEPTNRVFLYSPRFGAVRQIVGPIEGDHREGIEIANTNEGAIQGDRIEGVDVRSNEVRPLGASNSVQPQGAETTVGIVQSTGLQGVMEGDAQIRLGAMLTSETVDDLSAEDASLMLDGVLAAQGWSGEQGVAVSTDLVNVFSNAYVEGAATIYQIKDDTKTSKLRVVKIANKDAAKPGEFVEFTLRFENIGDEPIGNVTILDDLSTRLRYVDGTAQSSVESDFFADLNEKGSLILRWEITKPLYPKEFGVVRFICKVQ